MAYQELIKDFNTTRSVLRDFYVQGFHTRQDFRLKSLRSYDNERRRVESWLRDAMGFRQEPEGKVVFLTVDCRTVRHNPLYEAFRAKSFTPWDAALHFLLLDLFHRQGELSFAAVADQVCGALLQANPDCPLPDAFTIRNKLKEGVELGIFCSRKVGKSLYYRLADAAWNPAGWSAALCFASEALPLGIVGAYLLDRYPEQEAFLSFKHHYLSGALDQEILCQLAAAHEEKRKVRLEFQKKEGKAGETLEVYPLKVYCSTATGRNYLLAGRGKGKRPQLFRLDRMEKAAQGETDPEWAEREKEGKQFIRYLWGIGAGSGKKSRLDHVELDLYAGPEESYIPERLLREKRQGKVVQVSPTVWRFSIDVYDAREMLPWLRTFLGRILRLECSDPRVTRRFWKDLDRLRALYEEG